MRKIILVLFIIIIIFSGCSKSIITYDESGMAIVDCAKFCNNLKKSGLELYNNIVKSECRDMPEYFTAKEEAKKSGATLSLNTLPQCKSNPNQICGCILNNGTWITG